MHVLRQNSDDEIHPREQQCRHGHVDTALNWGGNGVERSAEPRDDSLDKWQQQNEGIANGSAPNGARVAAIRRTPAEKIVPQGPGNT